MATHPQIPVEPPPTVAAALRERLAGRELQAMEMVFLLRASAQQAENMITEWMAGTAGSPSRYRILMFLWAAKGKGVSHKDIVTAMGVTRATVSGLMAALEGEGFVKSSVDRDDARKQLATLTAKGEAVVKEAHEASIGQLRAALGSLSSADLKTLTSLLQRVREGFAGRIGGAKHIKGRD
jgi:DNA-binding MarR family transcriptional regulator